MTWRIAQMVARTGATWRITRMRVDISSTPSNWRIARMQVSLARGWQISKMQVTIGTAVGPVLAPFTAQTVDPITPVTITATVTNGVQPDTYTFTPSAGLILSQSGNTAQYMPPGVLNGTTSTVVVTAALGAQSDSQTASFTVRKGTVFRVKNGQYVVVSPFQSLS